MIDPQDSPEDHLDDYLDGSMSRAEREIFERTLCANPELRRQAELQNRIDTALENLFPPTAPSSEHLSELKSRLAAKTATSAMDARPIPGHRRQFLAGLVAAAVACVAFAWWWNNHRVSTPFFEPAPVAQLYREAVRNGFEPYYECREADRFAATFLRRQGKPLQLLELPQGSRMLGLSYPGGLSRDTTAMLCRVDDQPVMVFVDRVEADKAVAQENSDPAIQVFREARDGLVFYEVTPFSDPRMTDYLATFP